jgi:K+-sensing histidine kinase KdpD
MTRNTETIRWENFANFVRQLSHDLRNQLNAAELQAALIGELTADPELKPEVMRLRQLVSKLGDTLQRLSVAVARPQPTRLPYPAKDLIDELQARIARDFPEHSQRVKWAVSIDGLMLDIDPGLIGWAATELFENAFRHNGSGALAAHGREEDGKFVFALHEPKKEKIDPSEWSEPLKAVTHGHYGLGLRRARAIVAAHGGELTSQWDAGSSRLTSRMVLPCSTESN